jgi:hypothetical protein
MASSFVPYVHDILLRLVASFLYDQVEALITWSTELCHDTSFAMDHITTMLNIWNTLYHDMSDV